MVTRSTTQPLAERCTTTNIWLPLIDLPLNACTPTLQAHVFKTFSFPQMDSLTLLELLVTLTNFLLFLSLLVDSLHASIDSRRCERPQRTLHSVAIDIYSHTFAGFKDRTPYSATTKHVAHRCTTTASSSKEDIRGLGSKQNTE